MLKNLFCKHKQEQDVICWHITHGPSNNEPAFLEIQLKCSKCGKYYFRYIKDVEEMNHFINTHKDKQWSDTCKPVLISKQIFYW